MGQGALVNSLVVFVVRTSAVKSAVKRRGFTEVAVYPVGRIIQHSVVVLSLGMVKILRALFLWEDDLFGKLPCRKGSLNIVLSSRYCYFIIIIIKFSTKPIRVIQYYSLLKSLRTHRKKHRSTPLFVL